MSHECMSYSSDIKHLPNIIQLFYIRLTHILQMSYELCYKLLSINNTVCLLGNIYIGELYSKIARNIGSDRGYTRTLSIMSHYPR